MSGAGDAPSTIAGHLDPVRQCPLGPAAAAAIAVGGDGAGAGPEAAPEQQRRIRQLDRQLRPQLCALVVAARVLRLSAEARYAAACLLCRYRCLVRDEDDEDRNCGSNQGHRRRRHRRHRRRNLDEDDAAWILGACLFLGAKVTEQPRRLRDVVNCIRMVRPVEIEATEAATAVTASLPVDPPEQHLGDDADTNTDLPYRRVCLAWRTTPPPLDSKYWAAKRRLVAAEQCVLRWLTFDAYVLSPHRAVLLVAERALAGTATLATPQQRRRALVRVAWRRINDTIFSLDCLRQPVLALACASVDLAGREVGLWNEDADAAAAVDCSAFEVSLEQFAASTAALESIRQQLSACV